jgi:hypothetical protein
MSADACHCPGRACEISPGSVRVPMPVAVKSMPSVHSRLGVFRSLDDELNRVHSEHSANTYDTKSAYYRYPRASLLGIRAAGATVMMSVRRSSYTSKRMVPFPVNCTASDQDPGTPTIPQNEP